MTPTIDLLRRHRSIRAFTDRQISDEERHAILAAARSASTSSFLQCSSIIRVTDPQKRSRLSELAGPQPGSAKLRSFGSFVPTLTATSRFALRPG